MNEAKRKTRRRYAVELKQQILNQCAEPGAHAYLFANRRANRMKVLVHDGIGVWLEASM